MSQQTQRRNKKRGTSAASSQEDNNVQIGTSQASDTISSDFSKLSESEIMEEVIARNKDPIIDQLMQALLSKRLERIQKETVDYVEAEKRGRSLVISGISEPDSGLKLMSKQMDLEKKVCDVLEALTVDCAPVEIYRLGKRDERRPRMVKVVLPSKSHWSTALANAHRLRAMGFGGIFVRRSMTADERRREFELRQEARDRNKGLGRREWVVYRGELKQVSELPAKSHPGNM